MEEIIAEINVIKSILVSFTEFPDKAREERLNDLKTAFPNNKFIFTYFDYERKELRELLKEQTELLKELTELFKEQQKKENLILAQGIGGGGIKRTREEEEEKKEKEIQKVIDSSVYIKIKIGSAVSTGNGVAVSNKKAVTTVHGEYDVGQSVQVIDIHGHAKNGVISFMKYETSKVDIAVIELIGSDIFDHYIPFHTQPVKIVKELFVIGLRDDGTGEYTECVRRSAVEKIIKNTAIIHVTYYVVEGMSGAGVVTIEEDGHYSVVGVHVAKHDDTETLFEEDKPKKKKAKKEDLEQRVQSLESNHQQLQKNYRKDRMTINSNIHGHGSYCLICEIARVDGLIDHLNL